ncbi:hypothetical protein CHU98_g8007 [Xylaria longipes]|nr:hypothetical protein CHU98_g8007 [Xylaria longipes]
MTASGSTTSLQGTSAHQLSIITTVPVVYDHTTQATHRSRSALFIVIIAPLSFVSSRAPDNHNVQSKRKGARTDIVASKPQSHRKLHYYSGASFAIFIHTIV